MRYSGRTRWMRCVSFLLLMLELLVWIWNFDRSWSQRMACGLSSSSKGLVCSLRPTRVSCRSGIVLSFSFRSWLLGYTAIPISLSRLFKRCWPWEVNIPCVAWCRTRCVLRRVWLVMVEIYLLRVRLELFWNAFLFHSINKSNVNQKCITIVGIIGTNCSDGGPQLETKLSPRLFGKKISSHRLGVQVLCNCNRRYSRNSSCTFIEHIIHQVAIFLISFHLSLLICEHCLEYR